MVEFRILGPLEVINGGGPVELRAPKQRSLLALLLLRANEVVTPDVLVEALWADGIPASSAKLLHIYVSQLRRALGPDRARLVTSEGGYRLSIDPDELDSRRFERLLLEGRAAREDGSATRARRILVEALDLWRGPALAEFAYDGFADVESRRLEELRLVALEERLETDLALGRHDAVLAELGTLAEEQPLRERVRALQMLALYRAGRQADALAVYSVARAALRDELGLEPGEQLRDLQGRILRQDPELAAPSVPRPQTRLPAPLTPLVGRDTAIAELVSTLRGDARLVTLSGAGGSGKTSLALAVARLLADEHADGAELVELAGVRDAELVPETIASVLGVEREPGESAPRALGRALRSREQLLVVDNFEHVRESGPLLVDLLATAPRLRLLVTSRVVLHLSGETVVPVPPLEDRAAVQLFLERAEAAAPGASAHVDRERVAVICRRLDNLPLAIELAAPRLRTLTLDELDDRLTEQLRLLTGGPRDAPARQQTLRATVNWSVGLLTQEARALLGRLSVFAGGFTFAGADAVADIDDVLDVLDELGDANLLRRRPDGRFDLLETIREPASELLRSSGEAPEAHARHAAHLLAVARDANLTTEAEGPMRHELVLDERDNIQAALAWALDADELELAVDLVFALENYWVTAAPSEGRRWLELLLAQAAPLDDERLAATLRTYANTLLATGDVPKGTAMYEESLAAYERAGDVRGAGIIRQRLALRALLRGDTAEARRLCERSLREHRNADFAKGTCVSTGVLAQLTEMEGDEEEAASLYEHAAELAEETGFVWFHASMLLRLGGLRLRQGALADAEARLGRAAGLAVTMTDRGQAVMALAQLARAAAAAGRLEDAGRLWGVIEAEEARGPIGFWLSSRAEHEAALLAHEDDAFRKGRAEGYLLSLEDAVARVAPAV